MCNLSPRSVILQEKDVFPSFRYPRVKVFFYILVSPLKQWGLRDISMKQVVKLSGFILIAVGTIGLLLNEFVWEHSSTRTIIFAVVEFVGLVNLAFTHWGMKQKT